MTTSTLPTEQQLEHMHRVMALIATAGERAAADSKAGRLQAPFYPVRGLEGVCAALSAAMQPRDQLVSTYRNLGDAIATGASLRGVVAELYGRADGVCQGKGGGMHLHDTTVGFMASTGIVGSGIPVAVGLGLAAQLDDDGRAVVVTFGDGATSIGGYHEAMNMAALWHLPVVFLCQNNQWAEHTPVAEYAPNPDFAERARGYGMEAVSVDGFDAVATWRVLDDALRRARGGGGPTFVECQTYRLSGHTSTADFSYVPDAEFEGALERDAAPRFRSWVVGEGLLGDARLDEIGAEAEETVADAFEFAQSAANPEPDARYEDVFTDARWPERIS